MSLEIDHFSFLPSELLENTFLHVSEADLLVNIQRVCRRFRDVVLETPSLPRKLFFTPKHFVPEEATNLRNYLKKGYKPVPSPYPDDPYDDQDYPRAGDGTWELNPLLLEKFPPWFLITIHGPVSDDTHYYAARDYLDHLRDPAFRYSKASWRNMLLCHPPIQLLSLFQLPTRGMVASSALYVEGGLRMGLLSDIAESYEHTFVDKRNDDRWYTRFASPFFTVGWYPRANVGRDCDRIYLGLEHVWHPSVGGRWRHRGEECNCLRPVVDVEMHRDAGCRPGRLREKTMHMTSGWVFRLGTSMLGWVLDLAAFILRKIP